MFHQGNVLVSLAFKRYMQDRFFELTNRVNHVEGCTRWRRPLYSTGKAWLQEELAYLVDGVAINGVSGGPAFFFLQEGTVLSLMGLALSVIPNRATGDVLPGLAVARHIFPFHDLIERFRSQEEAKQEETPLPMELPMGMPIDEPRSPVPTRRSTPSRIQS